MTGSVLISDGFTLMHEVSILVVADRVTYSSLVIKHFSILSGITEIYTSSDLTLMHLVVFFSIVSNETGSGTKSIQLLPIGVSVTIMMPSGVVKMHL